MNLLVIFLSIIQGLTEFLPISSSGHLAFFQNIFGMPDIESQYLLLDILLHFGTLIAVFIVFFSDIAILLKEIINIIKDIPKYGIRINTPYRKMVFMLVVSSIPAVFFGFLFKSKIEELMGSLRYIGVFFLITGFILFFTNKFKEGHKTERGMTITDSIIIGLFQALALLPGISRSGSTIAGGLLRGLNRELAVKFSFLMSIPIILGANLFEILKLFIKGEHTTFMPIFLVGVVVSAIVGFFSIKFLTILINKGRFHIFSFYCWGIGVFSIIYSFFIK